MEIVIDKVIPGLEDSSRLQALGQVSAAWLSYETPWRADAIQALVVSTGLKPRLVKLALENAFEKLTEAKLKEYLPEIPASARSLRTLHILPANVFTSGLPAIYTAIGMGHSCQIKPSQTEPVFAPLLKRSFDLIAPTLSPQLEIVQWSEALIKETDAVIAYGSDETLAALKVQFSEPTRFIGYGHKLSVAAIFKDALTPQEAPLTLKRLIADAELFDLKGCLSPQVVYVEGNIPAGWPETLAQHCTTVPKLKTFAAWPELKVELEKFKPYLSTLGVAGASISEETAKELGATRICPIGQMQKPFLDWRNGGIDLRQMLSEPLILGVPSDKIRPQI